MFVFVSSIVLSLVLAVAFVPSITRYALHHGIVDRPDLDGRKWHRRATPLLGGAALFGAFAVTLGVMVAVAPRIVFGGRIHELAIIAVLVGGCILVAGGYYDDRYRLSFWRQLCFPMSAVVLVAWAGIGVERITNPFGGVFTLLPWATFGFTILWLLGTTYTMKLLDGLDGLVCGVTAIGALMIAALSLTATYYQPDVAVLAFALTGASVGVLVFNFYPAKIFLGEGGSTLCGFLLGVLAIISGGKIATALLVMGIPVVDVVLVVAQRLLRRTSIVRGDRSHLHFRLLQLGFSHRGAVLFLFALSAGFGVTTLFFQARQKLVALGVLALSALGLSIAAATRERVRGEHSKAPQG